VGRVVFVRRGGCWLRDSSRRLPEISYLVFFICGGGDECEQKTHPTEPTAPQLLTERTGSERLLEQRSPAQQPPRASSSPTSSAARGGRLPRARGAARRAAPARANKQIRELLSNCNSILERYLDCLNHGRFTCWRSSPWLPPRATIRGEPKVGREYPAARPPATGASKDNTHRVLRFVSLYPVAAKQPTEEVSSNHPASTHLKRFTARTTTTDKNRCSNAH